MTNEEVIRNIMELTYLIVDIEQKKKIIDSINLLISVLKNERTDGEVQAYVEGYNDCFEQFCECLDMSKIYNRKVVEEMMKFVSATNSVGKCGAKMKGMEE